MEKGRTQENESCELNTVNVKRYEKKESRGRTQENEGCALNTVNVKRYENKESRGRTQENERCALNTVDVKRNENNEMRERTQENGGCALNTVAVKRNENKEMRTDKQRYNLENVIDHIHIIYIKTQGNEEMDFNLLEKYKGCTVASNRANNLGLSPVRGFDTNLAAKNWNQSRKNVASLESSSHNILNCQQNEQGVRGFDTILTANENWNQSRKNEASTGIELSSHYSNEPSRLPNDKERLLVCEKEAEVLEIDQDIPNDKESDVTNYVSLNMENNIGQNLENSIGLNLEKNIGLNMENILGLKMENILGLNMDNNIGLKMENNMDLDTEIDIKCEDIKEEIIDVHLFEGKPVSSWMTKGRVWDFEENGGKVEESDGGVTYTGERATDVTQSDGNVDEKADDIFNGQRNEQGVRGFDTSLASKENWNRSRKNEASIESRSHNILICQRNEQGVRGFDTILAAKENWNQSRKNEASTGIETSSHCRNEPSRLPNDEERLLTCEKEAEVLEIDQGIPNDKESDVKNYVSLNMENIIGLQTENNMDLDTEIDIKCEDIKEEIDDVHLFEGKPVSSWMTKGRVWEFEENGGKVEGSDGGVTYTGESATDVTESDGNLDEKKYDILNCQRNDQGVRGFDTILAAKENWNRSNEASTSIESSSHDILNCQRNEQGVRGFDTILKAKENWNRSRKNEASIESSSHDILNCQWNEPSVRGFDTILTANEDWYHSNEESTGIEWRDKSGRLPDDEERLLICEEGAEVLEADESLPNDEESDADVWEIQRFETSEDDATESTGSHAMFGTNEDATEEMFGTNEDDATKYTGSHEMFETSEDVATEYTECHDNFEEESSSSRKHPETELAETSGCAKSKSTYRCSKCDAQFSDRSSMTMHSLYHKNIEARQKNGGESAVIVKTVRVRIKKKREKLKEGETESATEKPSEIYQCKDCGNEFNKSYSLLRHRMGRSCNIVKIVCEVCGESFSRKDFKQHTVMCATVENLECQKCSEIFTSQSSLQEHCETHAGNETSTIGQVPVQSNPSENSQRNPSAANTIMSGEHMSHSSPANTITSGAHVSHSSSANIIVSREHVSHSSSANTITSGEHVSHSSSANTIVSGQHVSHSSSANTISSGEHVSLSGISPLDVKGDDSQLKFKCQDCDQKFSHLPLLVSHSLFAHPSKFKTSKKFNCRICNLAFISQFMYIKHMMKHSKAIATPEKQVKNTEDKPLTGDLGLNADWEAMYPCRECDQRFSEAFLLLSHSLSAHATSTDLKVVYNCRSCCLYFNSQATYIQHLLIHSESKPPKKQPKCSYSVSKYKCQSCHIVFHSQAHYIKHFLKCNLFKKFNQEQSKCRANSSKQKEIDLGRSSIGDDLEKYVLRKMLSSSVKSAKCYTSFEQDSSPERSSYEGNSSEQDESSHMILSRPGSSNELCDSLQHDSSKQIYSHTANSTKDSGLPSCQETSSEDYDSHDPSNSTEDSDCLKLNSDQQIPSRPVPSYEDSNILVQNSDQQIPSRGGTSYEDSDCLKHNSDQQILSRPGPSYEDSDRLKQNSDLQIPSRARTSYEDSDCLKLNSDLQIPSRTGTSYEDSNIHVQNSDLQIPSHPGTSYEESKFLKHSSDQQIASRAGTSNKDSNFLKHNSDLQITSRAETSYEDSDCLKHDSDQQIPSRASTSYEDSHCLKLNSDQQILSRPGPSYEDSNILLQNSDLQIPSRPGPSYEDSNCLKLNSDQQIPNRPGPSNEHISFFKQYSRSQEAKEKRKLESRYSGDSAYKHLKSYKEKRKLESRDVGESTYKRPRFDSEKKLMSHSCVPLKDIPDVAEYHKRFKPTSKVEEIPREQLEMSIEVNETKNKQLVEYNKLFKTSCDDNASVKKRLETNKDLYETIQVYSMHKRLTTNKEPSERTNEQCTTENEDCESIHKQFKTNKELNKTINKQRITENEGLETFHKQLKTNDEAQVRNVCVCYLCCKQFKTRMELGAHQENIHFKYECKICYVLLGDMSQKLAHEETVHYKIKSPHSGKPFRSNSGLQHYTKKQFWKKRNEIHPSKQEADNSASTGYRCWACLKEFDGRTALRQHHRDARIGSKRSKCPVCNKGFWGLCTLAQHVKTHQQNSKP